MRKFNVNLHFDIVVPVEVEAINEEEARSIAEGINFDPRSKFNVEDVKAEEVKAEEGMFDLEDTIDDLVYTCIDMESGKYSSEELEEAAREVVNIGSNVYEQYTREDIALEILSVAERNREDLEKTMERCRGENF